VRLDRSALTVPVTRTVLGRRLEAEKGASVWLALMVTSSGGQFAKILTVSVESEHPSKTASRTLYSPGAEGVKKAELPTLNCVGASGKPVVRSTI